MGPRPWRPAVELDGALERGDLRYAIKLADVHLPPFFKDHHLSQITVAEVDRYREAKLGERALGATSINKTITRLGQILEVAVERGGDRTQRGEGRRQAPQGQAREATQGVPGPR